MLPNNATHLTRLIFDVGNVLVRFDDDLWFERLSACCTDSAGARARIDGWYRDGALGTGRLGIPEVYARLVADHGFRGDYPRFIDVFTCHFSESPGMTAIVRALAVDYRIALLSNSVAPHWDRIVADYPVVSLAHAAYLSHELGLVKPDPSIYRRMLELEGCRAEECLFIDDLACNTKAAADLGMKTITFTNRDAFVDALAGYGIVPVIP
jgi:putative hydrolase of the HAD superfamily